MRNLIILIAVLGSVLLVANDSQAYRHKHCGGNNIRIGARTLRYSTRSFPAGGYRNALYEARNRLNDNPSWYNYGLTADGSTRWHANGQSEVWGADIDAPAYAYTSKYCFWFFGWHYGIGEVDIVFDYGSPWRWTYSTYKRNIKNYGGSKRPLQTTALHEMGHGLYLGHVNYTYNIMGSDPTHIHVNGSTARAYLGEDAANGMVHLFGTRYYPSFRQDLGVVHWRYSGTSGEYSAHTKTIVTNSSGGGLATVTVNGEKHYRVSKGQLVKVQFTYENNGASTQYSVPVGFYLSTDSYISTYDTRLGGVSLSLGRNTVFTRTDYVRIPSNLISGRNYWLGAIVDETGRIAERVEWNNATYLPIRIN